MAQKTSPTVVTTVATVRAIKDRLIAPLPEDASTQLPSRGQVAVEATLNDHRTQLVIEPDGRQGHWIRLDDELLDALGVQAGDRIDVTLTRQDSWPEPEVPGDLEAALAGAPDVADTWTDITPMARWEWVRWVGSTKNPDTRARRVNVSIDKMRNGKRRPCCFNLASCTDPEISASGKLLGLD